MPIVHFLHDNAESKSFRYLGNGVKLGEAGRIVCWYRVKGAQTYRAVYGDLTIKNLRPDELPLPTEESR